MKAVIFDFDGVIANSKEYHFKSFNDALSDLNVKMTRKEFKFGKPAKHNLGEFFKRRKIKADPEKYRKLKNKFYLKYIKKVQLNKGAKKIIEKLNKDYKLAITSNTTVKEIEILIKKNKIKRYFKTIVGWRSTKRHKPHPEPFLKAAERLNVRPGECIVIEDSPYGVEAAKRAKMNCIALLTTHKKSQLKRADVVLKDLENTKDIVDAIKNF